MRPPSGQPGVRARPEESEAGDGDRDDKRKREKGKSLNANDRGVDRRFLPRLPFVPCSLSSLRLDFLLASRASPRRSPPLPAAALEKAEGAEARGRGGRRGGKGPQPATCPPPRPSSDTIACCSSAGSPCRRPRGSCPGGTSWPSCGRPGGRRTRAQSGQGRQRERGGGEKVGWRGTRTDREEQTAPLLLYTWRCLRVKGTGEGHTAARRAQRRGRARARARAAAWAPAAVFSFLSVGTLRSSFSPALGETPRRS